MERLSLRSFVIAGYHVTVWSYTPALLSDIVEKDVTVADASVVLSSEMIFVNKFNSYASFADYFRYSVLRLFGGVWSDFDVLCIKRFEDIFTENLLVCEHQKYATLKGLLGRPAKVNNNMIFYNNSSGLPLMEMLECYSRIYPKNLISWGELGPDLLSSLTQLFPHHGFRLMDPIFANPIPYWSIVSTLLRKCRLRNETYFLHMYSEMWKRSGLTFSDRFPRGSFLEEFESSIF